MSDAKSREIGRRVLQAESDAIGGLVERLGPEFDTAVEAITRCTGRLVLTGMGKSGLVCRKIAATFSSTGTPALFVHPAEAVHGDLGGIVPGDVVACASYTGETEELVRLLPMIREVASTILALCGQPQSTLGRFADACLDVSVAAEACPLGLAPTASSTATLAMGDALAMAVSRRKGFTAEDFGRVHPGGSLGLLFRTVADLMHSGEDLPRVGPGAPLRDVISEMTSKRLGMTTVVDGDRLVGVIVDGDLRRLLERDGDPLARTAGEVMTTEPRTVAPDLPARRALALMEGPPRPITSLVVVDDERRALGVLHVHDLWGSR